MFGVAGYRPPGFLGGSMDNVQLFNGDCLEVLKSLAPGSVDAVVTDPPYGVGFKGKRTKHECSLVNVGYDNLSDTADIIHGVAVPAVRFCIEKFGRAAVFPGIKNMWYYPHPKDVGGVFCPNGAGMSPWGFTCLHPVLFYGGKPAGIRGPTPTVLRSTVKAEKNGHPCPKPLEWMVWLIEKCSLPGDTILDPFMGSGTTGVACVQTGRKFIGIEIDTNYFAIAQKRIADAVQVEAEHQAELQGV